MLSSLVNKLYTPVDIDTTEKRNLIKSCGHEVLSTTIYKLATISFV